MADVPNNVASSAVNDEDETDEIDSSSGKRHGFHFSSPLSKLHSPFHRDRNRNQRHESSPDPTPRSQIPNADIDGSTIVSDSVVRSAREWDVKMPPAKKRMVHGKLIPTIRAFGSRLLQKQRRIVIEIHSKGTSTSQTPEDKLSPGDRQIMRGLLRGDSFDEPREDEVLNYGEEIIIRVLKPKSHWGRGSDSDDEDDSSEDRSMSTLGNRGVDEGDDDREWIELRKESIGTFDIIKVHRHTMEVKSGLGAETAVRSIVFQSAKELKSFQEVLTNLRKLKRTRADLQLSSYIAKEPLQLGDIEEGRVSHLTLLVEICSATHLPAADIVSGKSDPRCIVFLGGNKIHRTKHISKTLDPIWTVETKSLFLLSTTPEEFFSTASGVNFVVEDYDIGGRKNDILGKLKITPRDFLEAATGERIEYDLVQAKSNQGQMSAKLTLRIRHATNEDLNFMKFLKINGEKKQGLLDSSSFVPPKLAKDKGGFLKRETKKGPDGQQNYRVKPTPDPKRREQTMWMSKQELINESIKPSHNWIEAGSGGLGKVYFEVIGCEGLPNCDTRLLGKTDAFATVVYEDTVVNTDVVSDTLSPRFMPWTQRAFVFDIIHPSSQIFVGISDYDSESRIDTHDAIGRIAVDITNLKPHTVYMLHYDLYTSALVTKRKNYGRLIVRLRIEWNSERKALLASLLPPAKQIANVVKHNDFMTANYACQGKYNPDEFDLDTLASYLNELQTYDQVLYYIKSAALCVLLWRKPMHSTVAFLGGVLLVENSDLFPSFLMFGIAWIFLATMNFRRQLPSPWHGCRSYSELFRVFCTSHSSAQTIAPNENLESIKQYEVGIEKRIQDEKDATKKKKEEEEEFNAYENELDEELRLKDDTAADTSKTKGFSINPLKPFLFPAQQLLGIVCVKLRIIKSIVMWDESYEAFWIISFCFVSGLLLLWVPWGFLVRWALRIIVWTLLGPWMKLVDILFIRKRNNPGKEEKRKHKREERKERWKARLAAVMDSQIKKENALKLRAMKKVMFGKYNFKVPQFKDARHVDYPLPPSSASPHIDMEKQINVVDRRFGQHLVGDMIPARGKETDTDEVTESTTENTPLKPKKTSPRGLRGYGSSEGVEVDLLPLLDEKADSFSFS